MNKKIIIGAVAGLLLMTMVFTNPDSSLHKDAVKLKFNSFMQKKMNDDLGGNKDEGVNIGGQLGMMFGNAIIDRVVDSAVSSDNYLLFSLTKFTFKGESRVMGIGVFGNVFISDKVDEELDKQMDNVGI